STPPDGSSATMTVGLFSFSPNRDADLDNGVVIHEYGHGVSNRLTGNANGLNARQSGGMGEGWSDWWALMFTQRTATEPLTGRGVGTYVLGQPPTGRGIRRFPYSFNMTIDPLTFRIYNQSSEVHNAGEIWCTALWDMNELLIEKYGYNPDITGGYAGSG